jgi:putative membrane protein
MRPHVLAGPACLLALALAGCREAPGPLVRDHYASLEECVADWGRAGHCDRVHSSGYSGGRLVFRSPAYPQNAREPARREALAGSAAAGEAVAPDATLGGRAIGTVLEPSAMDGARPRGRIAPPPSPDDDVMTADPLESLAGLPYFVAYLGVALMLLTAGVAVHVALSARRDMQLIREGNVAVAADMAGVLAGLALPLASALLVTETLFDLLVWSGVAVLVQLLVTAGLRLTLSALVRRARSGQLASGVFLGAMTAVLGLLNAAALVVGL